MKLKPGDVCMDDIGEILLVVSVKFSPEIWVLRYETDEYENVVARNIDSLKKIGVL